MISNPQSAPTGTQSEFPLQPIEVISVLTAGALVVVHLILFARLPEFWHWSTPLVILLGLVGADFVSGVVHWVGDTWGNEGTPWLGQRFIRPFRFHHAHPLNMLRSNFFTTNGDTALSSLPFLLIPFLFPLDTSWGRLSALFVASVGGWGMWTSQCHQWAHMKSPPRVVAWLQRRGLILSREHHRWHHKAPFAANYCITTGWCNGVLSAIRFFSALEWVVQRLTGWRPRSEPADSYADGLRG